MKDFDYLNSYRYDNDDGTKAFFDATLGVWETGVLEQELFKDVFGNREEAKKYLLSEILTRKNDGLPFTDYERLLVEDVINPAIVVILENKAVIWDGYHRIAGSISQGKEIRAFYCIVD